MSINHQVVTHLLTLPNELFPYLLDYLSIAEILKAFLELSEHNKRLASLITPYLSYINLSHESNFWLSTRLPKFRERVYSVCATARQIAHIHNLPSLETLTISNIHDVDEFAKRLQYLNKQLPKLYSVKLKFTLEADTCNLFSNFDLPLEEFDLSLRCSFIPIGSMIHSLRHLTLRVNTMRDLFDLGEQLPVIESLCVNVNGFQNELPDCISNGNAFIVRSPYLKRVSLLSRKIIYERYTMKYRYDFEHYEKFIYGCASSLEYLTLDLVLPTQSEQALLVSQATIVDGDRLEQGIIAGLPHLQQFQFRIEFQLPVRYMRKYQSSFANALWRQRCIVIDYPTSATLPDTDIIPMVVFSVTNSITVFDELYIASSQITDWHLNIQLETLRNPLRLSSVHSITLSLFECGAIVTLDLVRWMVSSFPRLRRLTLVRENYSNWELDDESISYPIFKSIRVLYFHGTFPSLLIRRFLFMCPRLTYLEVSRKGLLKQIVTDPKLCNDPYLKNLYHQIIEVQLTGSGDYVNFGTQLRDFFPRAHFL